MASLRILCRPQHKELFEHLLRSASKDRAKEVAQSVRSCFHEDEKVSVETLLQTMIAHMVVTEQLFDMIAENGGAYDG